MKSAASQVVIKFATVLQWIILCFVTPDIIDYLLHRLYAEDFHSLKIGCIFLVAVWVLVRPNYIVASIGLLWSALYFLLAPFGWETHSPATITFDEIDFYAPWYDEIQKTAFLFGGVILAGGLLSGWRKKRGRRSLQ